MYWSEPNQGGRTNAQNCHFIPGTARRAARGDSRRGSRSEQARVRLGTFTTSAIAAREFAGNFVFVQRVTSFGALTLKRVMLNSNSTATFKLRFARHGRWQLRVVMPAAQAAPGYIAGFSRVLTVRR